MLKFTLIMSVYAKESPLFFSQCLDSILAQSALPDEFIIIKDGPLTSGLDAVLDAGSTVSNRPSLAARSMAV